MNPMDFWMAAFTVFGLLGLIAAVLTLAAFIADRRIGKEFEDEWWD